MAHCLPTDGELGNLAVNTREMIDRLLIAHESYDYQTSLELSLKLIGTGNSHHSILSIAGHSAYELGLRRQACIYMQQSLRMKWNSGRACEVSRMYLSRCMYFRSLKYAKLAVRYDPNDPEPHFVLGEIYRDMGNTDLAMYAFSEAEARSYERDDIWEIAQEEMILLFDRLGERPRAEHRDGLLSKLWKRSGEIESPWLLGMLAIHAKERGLQEDYKKLAAKSVVHALPKHREVFLRIFSDLDLSNN